MNRRQLRRWLYKVTRPSSFPYVSGDSFRRLARHVCDETHQRISARQIQDGDVVFVATDFAPMFFEEISPHIRAKYVLITHNSDVPADESLIARSDDHITAWFAQNNTYGHPKVVPIPIGLENLYYYHVGVPRDYAEVARYSGPKQDRILAGFTIATNPGERRRVHDIASMAPCINKLPKRLGQMDYLETLVTHKFLLSPPGNGLDTHRTWEAMYLGVVPIVKDSVPMRSFEGLGLPIWIVQQWEELLSINERDLRAKYDQLRNGFENPALFMNYWRKRILDQRGRRPMEHSTDAASASAGADDHWVA